jgi:bifunctional oligoribonuclease and PAP phosphatase NrnA
MFKEFIQKIKNVQRVGVISHIRPDGDCIGAQIALSIWLKKNGVDVRAFNADDVPDNLEWLARFFPVEPLEKEELSELNLIILVDGNAIHRFSHNPEWQEAAQKPGAMIDHHPDPEDLFDLQYSVPEASSTCELIYKLIMEENPDHIDRETAMALYMGIITDTGSLQFDSVTPETVEVVADLLRRGEFKPNEVIEKIFSTKSIRQYKLLSRSLATIELFEDNQIAVMSVTQKMLEETGTTNSDTDGFVSYPLSIAGVKAAILVKDLHEDGIKMSLRSRSDDVNVNEWARELGGGGHKKAAGAWHPGPLNKAIRETIQIGKKQIDRAETPSAM